MRPFPRGAIGIVCVVTAAGLAALVAFHRPSQAQLERSASVSSMEPATVPPSVEATWEPTAMNAPGLPLQCSDGTWTRTVVRWGCARHGGVTY